MIQTNSAALRGSDMQQALRGAKHAIEVLQREWWNASSHTWKDVEAWQRCVIADALITYTLLAQDYSYVDVIEKAVKNRSGLSSNDDDLWSAIAALKTFFLTGDV